MKRNPCISIFAALLALLVMAGGAANATTVITDANTSLDWIVLNEEGDNDVNGTFGLVGTWERQVLGGNAFNGIARRSVSGDGSNTATWTFSNLEDGIYEVAANWQTRGSEATDSPYSINGGTPILLNQRSNPTGPPNLLELSNNAGNVFDVIGFQSIANDVIVDASTLTVLLTNDADGRVLADAIAIRKVANLVNVPEPATATLALLSLGGLVMRRRRNAIAA